MPVPIGLRARCSSSEAVKKFLNTYREDAEVQSLRKEKLKKTERFLCVSFATLRLRGGFSFLHSLSVRVRLRQIVQSPFPLAEKVEFLRVELDETAAVADADQNGIRQ